METPAEQTEYAIGHNQFVSLLMGENGYKHTDSLIETPTDLPLVFITGCNNYVMKDIRNVQGLSEAFSHAFSELIKTPTGTWWTIFIIHDYLVRFKPGTLQFKIDVLSQIPDINKSIRKFEPELRNCKQCVGYRFKNGLWNDVVRIARQINEHLRSVNSSVLLEEF